MTRPCANKQKKCHLVDFAVPADNRMKIKKSETINKFVDLARELKKSAKHESDGDTRGPQRLWKGT